MATAYLLWALLRMLVLIDESGCPGFKLAKGSTPHFVAAMVRFQDYEESEEASRSIANLRHTLGIKPEFKFSKCCDDYRDAFFSSVEQFSFYIRSLVVEKRIIYSSNLRSNCDSFYNFFVQNMLKHDGGTLVGARIKIDGSGDREFKRVLEGYLRRSVGPGKIQSVKFVDSRSDNLVQLADMCAGAIARSYKQGSRQDCCRWRSQLEQKRKLEDVWEFK